MRALEVLLTWVHVLGAIVFLGTVFIATFAVLPTLKTHLDYEHRQRFIVHFIPRVRSIMFVILTLLVLSGLGQVLRLYFTREAPPSTARITVFALHIVFAVVPLAIFALAPRILGKKSKAGLCCDPDAEDPPLLMGVTTSTGALLHYAAISGGCIAVLCGLILTRMG